MQCKSFFAAVCFAGSYRNYKAIEFKSASRETWMKTCWKVNGSWKLLGCMLTVTIVLVLLSKRKKERKLHISKRSHKKRNYRERSVQIPVNLLKFPVEYIIASRSKKTRVEETFGLPLTKIGCGFISFDLATNDNSLHFILP